MRKRNKKPGVAIRATKFIVGGACNIAEDVFVEAVNCVPGYPKVESYGQYLRRTKNHRRKK